MEVKHQFIDMAFFTPNWKAEILVLGTFNPSCGEQVDYFYGRNRNKFWKAIRLTFKSSENSLTTLEDKLSFLRKHQIACMDMIQKVIVNDPTKVNDLINGYSDQKLFGGIRDKSLERVYNTQNIKNYLEKFEPKKVLHTWGNRNNPVEFRNEITELKQFCKIKKILFIDDCPSPSNRSRTTVELISRFYTKHIKTNIDKTS